MKPGDLVKVVKNAMSLVIKKPGPKDDKFFNQVGTITRVYKRKKWDTLFSWYQVMFPAGIYEARQDTLEVIEEGKDFDEDTMWKMWGDK